MLEILKLIFERLQKSYRDLISALAITLLTLYILQGLSAEKELKQEIQKMKKDCNSIITQKDEELREVRRELMHVVFGVQSTKQSTHQNDSIIRNQLPKNIMP